MRGRIRVLLTDGRVLDKESRDYPGFRSHPMSCEMARDKFDRVAALRATEATTKAVVNAVANLEDVRVRDLMELSTSICGPAESRTRKYA